MSEPCLVHRRDERVVLGLLCGSGIEPMFLVHPHAVSKKQDGFPAGRSCPVGMAAFLF